MRINEIEAQGLKGGNFTHALGPLVYIVGENGAGKSRIGDAMTLALSGYHPNVGGKAAKTNEAVMQLATADFMGVRAKVDAGMVTRSWQRGKKGVSKAETFDGLADGWAVPPVMLDIQSYLEKSDEARVQAVFDLARVDGLELTAESMAAKMKNIKLEENTEHSEAVIGDIVKAVYDGWKHKEEVGDSVQAFLASLADCLDQRLKTAAQSLKRMNLTVQGLEQLKAAAAAAKAPPDPATERKLAASRSRRDELVAEKATIEEAGKRARTESARLTELDRLLAGSNPELLDQKRAEAEALRRKVREFKSETADVRVDIEKAAAAKRTIDANWKTANERLAAQQNKQTRGKHLVAIAGELIPLTADYKAKEEERDRLDAAIRGYTSRTDELRKSWQDKYGEHMAAGNDANAANAEIAKREQALTDLDDLKTCPYCRSCDDGWRTRLRSLLMAELSGLRTKRDRLVESAAKLRTVCDAANALLTESEAADKRHEDTKNERARAEMNRAAAGRKLEDATRAQTEFDALGDCSTDAAQEWISELEREAKANDTLAQTLATRLEQCQSDDKLAADRAEALATAEDVIKSMEAVHSEEAALRRERGGIAHAPKRVEELLQKHADNKEATRVVDAEIARLEEEQRRATAARADGARKVEALDSATRAKAEIEATKQAVQLVADERSRVVEKAFEPILATANKMAEPLLGAPLIYRDGRIGRTVAGRFVGQATFSGFQRAVVCCAMSVALAAQSPVKIAIIDEVDISPDNREKLALVVEALVDNGTIDQAVCIGTTLPTAAAGKKWTVIRL